MEENEVEKELIVGATVLQTVVCRSEGDELEEAGRAGRRDLHDLPVITPNPNPSSYLQVNICVGSAGLLAEFNWFYTPVGGAPRRRG